MNTAPSRFSLRIKGVLSIIAATIYIVITTAILTEERLKLPIIVSDLERVHRIEEQVVQVNMHVARAIIAASEAYFIEQGDIRTRQLFMEMAPLETTLTNLSRLYPPLKPQQEQLTKLTRLLAHQPSKAVLELMHATLNRSVQDLNNFSLSLRKEKQSLLTNYQGVHDKLTVETILFSFLGIIIAGAIMTIFFTRLTWDIRRVGTRAMAIVKGYRGQELVISRTDEIGDLMEAINQMQSELRDRERQIELSRQQHFHHEKMIAVGTLAAAVAHEINNPIMAISGLAQLLLDQNASAHEQTLHLGSDTPDAPAMILEQAKRISSITRQISEFSTPQSHDPQLVDLNTIARSTIGLIRFDQRFRQIDLQFYPDNQASAVVAVADHISQVLINLLINAADSFESVTNKKYQIHVKTTQESQTVLLSITDNGCGMDSLTLARACDEFFTTKKQGQGSGLGLYLSNNLLIQNGAKMNIDSNLGQGTIVTIAFPKP